MPTPIDITFAVFFAVVVAGLEAVFFDKRFKREVASGAPDVRRRWYRRAMIGQWVLAGVAIALWAHSGRSWTALGLVPPTGWRLGVGIASSVAVVGFAIMQILAVRRMNAERRAQLRPRLSNVEFVLPHTVTEYRWFVLLSVTAGVCEELLYRGFLTWLLGAFLGLPAAIALVATGFGLAHAYQGGRGVIKTSAVSLVMSLIVVASGWLIPAMLVHALVDITSGVLGFSVYREQQRPAPPVTAVMQL